MGKPKGRRAASSRASAMKKEKATGWMASTFSKADLNKLRAAGLLAAATEVMMPGEETVPCPQQGYRDHHFISSLPPLHEGGNVPEAAVVTESEAADTGATPEVDDDDEEDAQSEVSQTKASPPSATSRGEEEVQKKEKRVEITDDSESSAAEQRLEDERSAQETREEDIRKRLEALNTSLLRCTEHPTALLDEEKVDPTLEALKLLEGNNIYGRNVINNCRKAIVRLHGHVFPTEKLAPDYNLLKLVRSFAAPVDPLINYRRSQRQSGVEVAMATLMVHVEPVDWEKVSSSYPKDATDKKKLLQPYLIKSQKYSGAFVAMMQPMPGASSSAATPSTGTPAPESFYIDPFTASTNLGFRNPQPEVYLDSGVTTPPTEAPDSFISGEQSLRIKELEGELSSLKKQLLVALGKSKHAVDYDKMH
ncbi:hypothetical protein ACQ4PT_026249 [Festuca glaucescens]